MKKKSSPKKITKKSASKKAASQKTAAKKAPKKMTKKKVAKKTASKRTAAPKKSAPKATKKKVTLGWVLLVQHSNGDADAMVCSSQAEQLAYADEIGTELMSEGKTPGKDFEIQMSSKAVDIEKALKF